MREPAHVKVLRNAARSLSLRFSKFDPEAALHVVGKGKQTRLINRSATEFTSRLSYVLADNKMMTVDVLKKFGLPVPKQKLVATYNDLLGFYRKHRPVVVKPNKSSLGKGVTVGVNSLNQLKKAFKFAKKYGKKVLIEEFVPGQDYRVTVIDYKHIYVVLRMPAFVEGDGKHDIEWLVKKKNKVKKKYKKDIRLDEKSEKILAEKGFTFDSVPAKEEKVFLRKAANIAEGGTSIDFTDQISDKLKQIAIEACRVLKLPSAGVDILTEDISSNKGVIIEVNPRPHIALHHYPHVGKSRFPGRDIIKMLFSEGRRRDKKGPACR